MAITASAVLVAASAISTAHATDTTAQAALDQGNALYAQRNDTDQTPILNALKLLSAAEGTATTNDINFDILILESRALYWQGQHTVSVDDQKTIYLNGQAKAVAARALSDAYAEGPYYAGINLARWGEANGIVASIGHKAELIQDMADASNPSRATRDGDDGETIDGYGPDRVLGRLYYKLPAILGGNFNTSVADLTISVQKAPNYALNILYLVDTLEHGSAAQQAQGKQMLTSLLAQNPETFNPDRLPETLDEFQLGRDYQNGKPLP